MDKKSPIVLLFTVGFLTASCAHCAPIHLGSGVPQMRLNLRHSSLRPKFMAKIDAGRYWNHTGIMLEAGATYELVAAGIWIDAGLSCDPDGYARGNFIQDLFKCLRRSPRHQWFTLMGSIGCHHETIFPIGSYTTYVARKTGELVCFANDVPGFYWNNKGVIELKATRIR
jgi:hypothetical protein